MEKESVTDSKSITAEPFGALNTGDVTDDDGQAHAEQFEEAPSGPLEYAGFGLDTADSLPAITRIIGGTLTLAGDGINPASPVMIFPADPNRLELFVETDANTLIIASDQNSCFFGASFPVGSQKRFYSLCHTGAVWVYSTGLIPVVIAYRAVTK